MARENFDPWYRQAREYERGKDDDKRDPGGRTAEGITQREFDVYNAKLGRPQRDVWTITDNEVRIFYKMYWDRIRGDELPGGIDFVTADTSLNSGPSQSAKFLQRALKMNNVDGEIGPATIAAAANPDHDNDAIVADFCGRRLAFMKGLKTWDHFGKGWSARVANSLKYGQALATGSVPPDPVILRKLGGAAKASPLSIKQPLIPVTATQVGNGVGLIGSTASTIASQAQPLSDTFPLIQKVFLAATVISIAAGGVAFWLEQRRKATENGSAATEVDRDADADAPIAIATPDQPSLPLASPAPAPVLRRNVDVSSTPTEPRRADTEVVAPPVVVLPVVTSAPEPAVATVASDDATRSIGGFGGDGGFTTGGGIGGDTSTPDFSTGGGFGGE